MLFIILLSVPLELGTVLGTMRCKIFLPLLLFTVVTALLPAQAQVQRCTDARTGKVTYTDGSCSADQRSQEVVPALSPQEKAAAQAAAAAARQPPVQIIQPPANPAEPVLVPYPVYPGSVGAYPPHHRPRPPHGRPPPPEPEVRWQCNVFRCYDGKGNVRPRP